jgi:biopolymer transport protein TolR
MREDVMRVAVTRDGKIYFRERRVDSDDLTGLIQTAVQEGAEKKVYLAADARAMYRDVKIALEQMRLAGIENIAIIAERRPE